MNLKGFTEAALNRRSGLLKLNPACLFINIGGTELGTCVSTIIHVGCYAFYFPVQENVC